MRKKPPKLPPENERVLQLLNLLFRGNQSQMADEIGVAQPVISRVVTGKLPPGKRLLAALGQHRKVNPAWLATGKGDPLLADGTPRSEGWPVPIASRLLPGPPSEFRPMLTPQVHHVPGVTYRESLYAVKAQNAVAHAMLEALRILPDDILILETNSIVWEQNVRMLDGRLVAIRVRMGGAQETRLQEVDVSLKGELQLVVQAVRQLIGGRKSEKSEEAIEEIKKIYGKPPREIFTGDKTPTEGNAKDNVIDSATQSIAELEDVAGVVVQLIRNY